MGQLQAEININGNRQTVNFEEIEHAAQRIGYGYGGEIVPASAAPLATEENLFFLAKEVGTYTHYGNIEIVSGRVGFVYKENNAWTVDYWDINNLLNLKADKTYVDQHDANLQTQIDNIIGSQASVSLIAKVGTATVVFVGTECSVALNASSNFVANTISITKGGDTIASTTNAATLSGTDTITPNTSGSTTYTASFGFTGATKTASAAITAVYPIYYGSGDAYTDATTQVSTPKTTPAGTYNVTVSTADKYVWFVVPATMSINHATMSGFEFPLEAPTNVTIEGVAYKAYRSSNTYDTGTLTIVIS